MEWLLHAIVQFVIWIDKQFQKPLYQVIPDLDRLLHEPARVLDEAEIVIGPKKRYATAVASGLLVALGLGCIAALILMHGKPLSPRARGLLLVSLFALPVASILFMFRVLRGGIARLTRQGIVLSYRGVAVHCPWALFNAVGQPFAPDRRSIRLPVAPAAVPFVRARRGEIDIASGQALRTSQLRFPAVNEAVLKAVYEVKARELGGLLLALGYLLGTSLPDPIELIVDPNAGEEIESVEPAVRGKDGWITVRLTRLAFPTVCCDCGEPTHNRQPFKAAVLVGEEHVLVPIPVCKPCQVRNRRTHQAALSRVAAIGFGAPILLGVTAAFLFRRPVFLVIGFIFSVLGGIAGVWIGTLIGRSRSRPVQLKRYSPRRGTVRIRFRRAEYEREMLEAMQVGDAVEA